MMKTCGTCNYYEDRKAEFSNCMCSPPFFSDAVYNDMRGKGRDDEDACFYATMHPLVYEENRACRYYKTKQ